MSSGVKCHETDRKRRWPKVTQFTDRCRPLYRRAELQPVTRAMASRVGCATLPTGNHMVAFWGVAQSVTEMSTLHGNPIVSMTITFSWIVTEYRN
jgi:hypothetical protein